MNSRKNDVELDCNEQQENNNDDDDDTEEMI